MGALSKNSRIRLTVLERRARVVELRKAGLSFPNIAEAINESVENAPRSYDAPYARDDLMKAMADIYERMQENVEDIRQLELQRLDLMFQALWPKALRGEVGAVDRILKIMERRARYLPLEQPIKIAPTSPDGRNPYRAMGPADRLAALQRLVAQAAQSRVEDGHTVEGEVVDERD